MTSEPDLLKLAVECMNAMPDSGEGPRVIMDVPTLRLFARRLSYERAAAWLVGEAEDPDLDRGICAITDTQRLEWLHSTNKDAEGYEYGVCKVKFDELGKLAECWWTASDHSDIDALIALASSRIAQEQK